MALTNNYYSGQGSLLMAERDPVTGAPLGFIRIGNVPELTIEITVDKFEHKESESGDRLLDLVLVKEKKGTFSFTAENLSIENLALSFWGQSAVVAGATVGAPGASVVAYLDKKCPLPHAGVSSVVVKDVTDTTTYSATTDYVLDARNGTITPLSTGTIDEDDVLHVTYTYAGYTNLEAFTDSVAPERYLRFEGLNTVTGKAVIVDMMRAQFDPGTNYGLINEELGSIEIAGSILADPFVTSGSRYFRQRNLS